LCPNWIFSTLILTVLSRLIEREGIRCLLDYSIKPITQLQPLQFPSTADKLSEMVLPTGIKDTLEAISFTDYFTCDQGSHSIIYIGSFHGSSFLKSRSSHDISDKGYHWVITLDYRHGILRISKIISDFLAELSSKSTSQNYNPRSW
jgi:hypothetical protein